MKGLEILRQDAEPIERLGFSKDELWVERGMTEKIQVG